MKTNDLYSQKKDCCGCELCSNSCPKSIITMKPDEEGFLYPQIVREDDCINCGICLKLCPVKSPGRQSNSILGAVGGYIIGNDDLRKSASGGFATAISRAFIKNHNGIVYGVSYDCDYSYVIFKRASTLDELECFRTSKYSQANKRGIYDSIKDDLKAGKNVLFIGLPCEVSALYHKVGVNNNNLYTISLICHGPTSPKVHEDYVKLLEDRYHSKPKQFSVRYKLKGWKPYYIHAVFDSGKQFYKEFGISDYGIAFQFLKRPSCSDCKYKYGENYFGLVSDITIGDFHAVSPKMPQYNAMGVSEACIHTKKGEHLIDLIKESCNIAPITLDKILTGNRALYESIPLRKKRNLFVKTYCESGLSKACNLIVIKAPILQSYYSKKVRNKVRKILNIIGLKK